MPRRARIAFHLARMAAWGGLLLRSTVARGEPPPSRPATVLLMFDVDDLTARRVAAEVRASGLEVKSFESPLGTHTVADVDLQSRAAGAAGAVDVDPATREVRIWTLDASTERVALRSVVTLQEDPVVLALRVVEVLRASLSTAYRGPSPAITRALERAPPRHDADAQAVVAGGRPSQVVSPRLGVTFGPAFGWGGVAWAGAWEGMLSSYWLWTPRWGLEVLGAAPWTSAARTVTAGTATLALGLAGGGFRARALAADWCALDFGAGLGVAAIATHGVPNAGYSGTDTTTWVATPYVRTAYAIRMVSLFWLQADVTGAVAIPHPSFTVPGGGTGGWGTPVVLAAVGVQLVVR